MRLWTAAVIVVESLYALWIASRGYFFQDDFLDFQVARQLGLGKRLLEQPVFGHFLPAFNVAMYLVSSITPYRWPIVEAANVVLFALSLVLLYRLLTTLFGPTWAAVPLVAMAGASFSLVPSLVWWASSLELLVAIPATLFLIDCHVRFLTTGRFRYAVFGGFSLAVGLAFYDGVVVSALFLVLMTVLFWPTGPGLKGLRGCFIAYRPAWLCYAVPVVLELGWRLSHLMLYRSPPPPDVSQGLQFISFSWTQTLVPMVFGVDAWLFGSHFGRIVAGAIGEAVAVPFIVWTILRKPAAGRAWILFGVTFLTMASLVDITRVSVFGPSAANDVRYVTLDAFFLPITLGLAFLPARGQTWRSARAAINPAPSPESGRNAAPTQARPPRRRAARWAMAIPALCTVVVLYAVALDFDQDRDTPVQWDYATRAFFKTFAASWADVASHADHPFLWDTEVNPVVINNAFYPYDTVSVTVGMLHTGLRFDAWGGTGFLLLSDGSVVPAVAVTQALGVVQGPPGVCVAAGAVPAGLSVPLNHALGAQRWFGLISYQSHTGAVVTESGGATVRFPRGSGTLLTSFPPTPMSSVAWGVPPHGSLCITRLKIILPAAEGTKPSTT